MIIPKAGETYKDKQFGTVFKIIRIEDATEYFKKLPPYKHNPEFKNLVDNTNTFTGDKIVIAEGGVFVLSVINKQNAWDKVE